MRREGETETLDTAVFHVYDISKIYRVGEVEIPALPSVSLDLYAKEFVVLLGASGSGKSTLLNILGGLDRPTTRQVFYCDHDLTSASVTALTQFRREHVGFVFQFYNLIPSLTALENVATSRRGPLTTRRAGWCWKHSTERIASSAPSRLSSRTMRQLPQWPIE